MEKPRQSFAKLCSISFCFFGIQIGFALQNANMSRIFQSLGEPLDDLTVLWIAAPLTGLLVQPVIGHYSDRTWTRFGRRRPYFFAGAACAALALAVMPEARLLWLAAVMLWLLDASLNVSMEPFRAVVGDMVRRDQHTAGYAVQTAFIGAGAVVGSIFPWTLDRLGVANVPLPGGIPDTVRFSFWFGGIALFAAVLWTVVTTREYSPEQLRAFDPPAPTGEPASRALAEKSLGRAWAWIAAGAVLAALVARFGLKRELFLLAVLLAAYGVANIAATLLARAGRDNNLLSAIVGDFAGMPRVMKQLAMVQFFSWSALFVMWIYTTPVVARYVFGSADPASAAYNAGGNWVDVLFAVYNGVAAIAALALLPRLARAVGRVRAHALCLVAGAAGFAMFVVVRDARLLLLAEVGIGIAWASILAIPYAILASTLPAAKLGVYIGLFNIFVVVPQLLVATVMGSVLRAFFPDRPIVTMAVAALVLVVAAVVTLRVDDRLPD